MISLITFRLILNAESGINDAKTLLRYEAKERE